ncbi:MAG: glycerophosphodiester phosphodiesterase family protein [Deltaproteobacteria bacterium]|nr:glycerophosphodiester phosphodiesterase family protein [Deltaproteobacteria bacterium]
MRLIALSFVIFIAALPPLGCGGGDDDDSGGDAEADDDASPDDDAADDDTVADDDSVDDDAVDDDADDDTDDDDTGECIPLFPDVLLAAHRGGSLHAPENTIPSYEDAFERGADIVEMDVRDTADGEYVIMHDDTVDRTTDGTGLVSDMTLAEIKALTVTDWMYGGAYPDLRVPTFEEALEVVRDHGGQAYLDMKTDLAAGAIEVVIDMGMEEDCFVYSSNWNKLNDVRATSADVRIQPPTASVSETQAIIDFFDPDPEHIELSDGGLTAPNIALIQTTGATISMDALGVRDILAALGYKEAWYQMMEMGVQIIQTDLIESLVEYRDSLCAEE